MKQINTQQQLRQLVSILTTLRKWIKKYEAEIRDQMELEGTSITPVEPTEKDTNMNWK